MRVICCICKLVVRMKEGKEGDSHTVCPVCMPAYLRAQGFSPEEVDEFRKKYSV